MSLSRPRLIALLNDALQRPLTLLCAPAGFGKSTLLSGWATEAVDRPALAWLTMDEDDNDPARFFAGLRAALRSAGADIGRSAAPPLSEAGAPSAKDQMSALLEDVFDLDHIVVLVLDDYQAIDHEGIDVSLAYLIDHLPDTLRVVVSTRQAPRLPLSRWRARQWVTEIGPDQLRFTADEAGQFLARTMGLALDAESVRTLATRSEGWVAGLQIAALSLQQLIRDEGSARVAQVVGAFSGEHRHVIDYLAAEVMRQQPQEIQDFVRETCILDRFSAELCDAVTGRSDSRRLLAQVERSNLFLHRLDDQGRWFRYHQLFADYLRNGVDDVQRAEGHRRASAWFESRQMGQEAILHALAARREDDVVRLLRGLVEGMLARGELTTLLGWLDMLPPSLVRGNHDLAGYKAWLLYMSGRAAEAEDYLSPAATQAPSSIMFALQAFLALNSDDPGRAVELSRHALERLTHTTSFFRILALFYQGVGFLRSGRPGPAVDVLRQSVDLGWAFGHRMAALDALGHLAPLMSAQGQLRQAELLCRDSLARCTSSDESQAPVSGLILVPLGMLAYERNALQSALDQLEAGTALCRRLGYGYHSLAGACALARTWHASGARQNAWNALAVARDLADSSHIARRQRMVALTTADLQLREGNVDAACRTLDGLDSAPEASIETGLLRSRLLLATGEPLAAMRLLGTIDAQCRSLGLHGTLVTVQLLQAMGHRANGGRDAALRRLEEAVSLAASGGYLRPFLDADPALAGLLRHVSQAAPAFVAELLDVVRSPATPRAESEPAVDQLTPTQLEVLRLVGQGLGNQQIAAKLMITVGTAKWHVSQIFDKLGVRNRAQAVAKAREAKFI